MERCHDSYKALKSFSGGILPVLMYAVIVSVTFSSFAKSEDFSFWTNAAITSDHARSSGSDILSPPLSVSEKREDVLIVYFLSKTGRLHFENSMPRFYRPEVLLEQVMNTKKDTAAGFLFGTRHGTRQGLT